MKITALLIAVALIAFPRCAVAQNPSLEDIYFKINNETQQPQRVEITAMSLRTIERILNNVTAQQVEPATRGGGGASALAKPPAKDDSKIDTRPRTR